MKLGKYPTRPVLSDPTLQGIMNFSVVHQLLRQLLECIPAFLLVVNGERQKKHILIREQFATPGDYRLHDLRQRIAIRLFNRGEKRLQIRQRNHLQ